MSRIGLIGAYVLIVIAGSFGFFRVEEAVNAANEASLMASTLHCETAMRSRAEDRRADKVRIARIEEVRDRPEVRQFAALVEEELATLRQRLEFKRPIECVERDGRVYPREVPSDAPQGP
jgi:hypothetical protein